MATSVSPKHLIHEPDHMLIPWSQRRRVGGRDYNLTKEEQQSCSVVCFGSWPVS